MICIPYIINGNYKVAQLAESDQEAEPCYVIEKQPNADEVMLFTFHPSQYAFNPNLGIGEKRKSNDFNFLVNKEQCKVEVDENDTAHLTIVLKTIPLQRDNARRVRQDFNDKEKGLRIENSAVFFNLAKIKNNAGVKIIVVELKMEAENEDSNELSYKFSVNVASQENIYDIVIDFGSEASQIWVARRSNDPNQQGNHMPLFKAIKISSGLDKQYKDDEIYQYDPTDTYLYKSLFFIKDCISRRDIQEGDLTFINATNDLIKILKDNTALPNMKLMDHSNVPLPTITLNGVPLNIYQKAQEIRGLIMSFFFQKALTYVDTICKQPVTCKITFLVPNTYTQKTLSSVHNQLMKDLNLLISKNRFNYIKGNVEVATFSESDASFCGWYDDVIFTNQNREEVILIIDIGKGTTDFSVVKVVNRNGTPTIVRLAKSGIVGAGNVMTFAILVSVICQIAKQKSISEVYDFIRTLAYHNDKALKNKLYKELESLKRKEFIPGRKKLSDYLDEDDLKNLNDINALSIEILTETLQNANIKNCYVADDDLIVSEYAKQLAKMFIDELKVVLNTDVHIDNVIFSGRGSLSEILKNAIMDALHGIDKNIKENELNPGDVKTGCLSGPLNRVLQLDHLNMSIIGWPQQLTSSVEITTKKGNDRSESWLPSWLKDFFNEKTVGQPTQNDVNRIFIPKANLGQHTKWDEVQGQIVKIKNDTNRFIIGNSRCYVKFPEGHSPEGDYKIDFNGNDFVIRGKAITGEFVLTQNSSDREGFLTETFFPMTKGSNNDFPKMPILLKVLEKYWQNDGTSDPSSSTEDPDDFEDE